MKSIAIIPLRAGSKGIPRKNKKKIIGRPLFTWVLTEAIFSNLTEIYVFTDDTEIISFIENNYKWSNKVFCVKRSEKSASDTASTETAMLELAEHLNYNFDLYCLLQATSPLTSRTDINKALDKVLVDKFDSSLSVVETKRFIWNKNGKSLNYDYLKRPRRQDFEGLLIENGAVYVTTKDNFKLSNNRLGGNIGIITMDEDTLTEIDEPNDFVIVADLLKNRLKKQKKQSLPIKTLCLDVDGVFTDAKINVSGQGELSKLFSMRDGMGLELLRDAGINLMVITAENSEIVSQRMKKLKIDAVFLGIKDKFSFLENYLYHNAIDRSEIAYMGDDINDLANIASCGMGICPNDAIASIKEVADLITISTGGNGAIREACEYIIKFNNRF